MQNYVESGDQVVVTLGSGETTYASGKAYKVGAVVGVINSLSRNGTVFTDQASAQGDVAVVNLKGVYTVPKATSLVITQGDLLYWDNTNKVFNKTSSGNTLSGFAQESAASDATTVKINLRQ